MERTNNLPTTLKTLNATECIQKTNNQVVQTRTSHAQCTTANSSLWSGNVQRSEIVDINANSMNSKTKATTSMKEEERTRIRNRLASQKFRENKRIKEHSLQEENNRLHSENTVLKYQVKQWKTEAKKLHQAMNEHLATCVLADGPNFQPTNTFVSPFNT